MNVQLRKDHNDLILQWFDPLSQATMIHQTRQHEDEQEIDIDGNLEDLLLEFHRSFHPVL